MAKFEKQTVFVDSETGRQWSEDEVALEEVREKALKSGSKADLQKLKDLSKKVADARVRARNKEGRTGVSVVATSGAGRRLGSQHSSARSHPSFSM